jgi:hypothetical protein
VAKICKDPIYRTNVTCGNDPVVKKYIYINFDPHRFPHNNFSSVYQIFTKLSHMIPLWKGKNPIYLGIIRSKVKVTVTMNRIFDNRIVSVVFI